MKLSELWDAQAIGGTCFAAVYRYIPEMGEVLRLLQPFTAHLSWLLECLTYVSCYSLTAHETNKLLVGGLEHV